MRTLATLLMAVTMALTAHPAAADPEPSEHARNVTAEVPSAPDATAGSSTRQTFPLLHRLRLHPGQDGLDVAETARRPRPDAD